MPLSRRGDSKDIADWIAYLVNRDVKWTTGQIISVDSGLSVTYG
ncbi:SDR family oxidoreductase (plasmid) [Haloferax mediterranei ATCC 33500]|uniref:SDR family oxidoreductase n=1 Tax=Haloferax mediterranei (strain ATCC 33500 / DSM 1411 / JCM 8866 / NBRC 14739 / NCIMB 2177 / R-4) TaxID=523841 RepID=A0A4P8PBP1_HALMT|nr:SDR family oxidoreductase [Haloferax mediterranei ATCC 33500]